jgi:hypothetical protein
MDQLGGVEVAIIEVERFQVEVLLVFGQILRADGFEGVGDHEAMLLVGLCGVLWVDGGLVAEGGGVAEVVDDEPLH